MNEADARQFCWGTTTPGDRRVRPQGALNRWTQVVGVVETSKVSSPDEGPTPMLFYPVRQSPASGYVLVRTDGDPSALLPGLRAALQAVDPNLPLSALGTLSSRLAGSLAMPTIATRTLGAFSLLAMLLTSLGLYGVVSLSVSRRSPEMGVRIAISAERTQLIQMVMREMLLTVTVGLAMGTGFAMLTAPALRPVLYQVSAVDITSFVFGAVLLVAVAALATSLPARRAAGVNPVFALRAR